MEYLSRAVGDPGGVIDIDGNGSKDEINLGCEVCHGPGSAHAAWAGDPANAGREARYVVCPDLLSPSREMMICGRCHDRPLGNGSRVTEEPLDVADRMPPPGISRREFLAAYVSRKGPAASDYWSDDLHSRSHHQQYSDLLKSRKHRNARYLVTCSDCHESHGNGPYRHHLVADPDDGVTGLCYRCHGTEILAHMITKTGVTHAGASTACVRCHMPQTAKSGAGVYGIILPGGTSGTAADLAKAYFHNDIASHLFLPFARRSHPDVKGVLPGFAMPIPFTNGCGYGCHDVAPLQLPKPGVGPDVVWPAEGSSVGEADDYVVENGSQR
jgi:cytochrome c553